VTKSKPDLTARQLTFLRRLVEAEQRLRTACSDLSLTTLDTEPVVGSWTTKDVVGHVISWNTALRLAIQAVLDNQPPGYGPRIDPANGFDEWNQAHIARMRRWTWRRMEAALARDYREAEALILRLQPGDFRRRGVTPWKQPAQGTIATPTAADTETVETLISYHWRHAHEHARQIEQWRKGRARRQLAG
jgi:hypothetical protein